MRKPRTARLVLAALAAAALLVLSACGPAQGPAGRVVDKDRYFLNKAWHYRLTTVDKAGKQHRFPVLRGDYNACYIRSSYPHCTEVR
ncbi:hypothetical protein ACIBL8_44155 [Streptomyces sp. NPDC050523]|uniref:hypothetical protein n=1 Tax=Streptomyces sp. NPDC050523 TaxID=3365622 RepID=UPI0037949147